MSRDESSFTSTSTMDSDYEMPATLRRLHSWQASEHVSKHLAKTLSGLHSIRESASLQNSITTASKWKKLGYHPYKPDNGGYTALHRAAKRGDSGVLLSLLAMYDGRATDLASMASYRQQQIALHLAARYGHLEAVRILTTPEFKPLVSCPDRNGNTPLHFAATSNTPDAAAVVALLLRRGADPTAKSRTNIFPIIAHVLTAQEDEPTIVRLLLKHGCDIDTVDAHGNSVLHIAVTQNLWKTAAFLVHHQARLDLRNDDGQSLLHQLTQPQLAYLAQFIVHPPRKVSLAIQKTCMVCMKSFGLLSRGHHCRLCGRACCSSCRKRKRHLPFPPDGQESVAQRRQLSPGFRSKDRYHVCDTCIGVNTLENQECLWQSAKADRLLGPDIDRSTLDFGLEEEY